MIKDERALEIIRQHLSTYRMADEEGVIDDFMKEFGMSVDGISDYLDELEAKGLIHRFLIDSSFVELRNER